jgi:hypothetical protein
MFHTFNKHHFKQTIGNLKHHLGRGYHHVKNIANNIDYGVSIEKEAYKILEPVIREYPNHHHNIHHHAMKAISGYESLRNNVLDANHHVATVGSKLGGLI